MQEMFDKKPGVSRRKFVQGLGTVLLSPLVPQIGFSKTTSANKTTHHILSCNIRVALPEDEAQGLGWSHRKKICIQIIKAKKPDIICLQEVLKVQSDDMRKSFPGFISFGFEGPEMDANPTGYHGIAKNPIMFSRSRYELISAGCFWLSETPQIAGSKSWDTARARHANWVRLREHNTNNEFRVINTHLDHVSQNAREMQVKMILDESKQYPATFAQIFTGDFNEDATNRVITLIKEAGWVDTYSQVHGDSDPGFTGHGFLGPKHGEKAKKGKIDFIFSRSTMGTSAASVIRDAVNGQYPSDHYFVSAAVDM